MRPFNRKKMIFIPFGIAALIAVAGFVVMSLWNALLPGIFHIAAITFWQAEGIFVLCKILFGFGNGGPMRGGPPWMRNRMEERLGNMSPEDREKFRAKMEERMAGMSPEDRERLRNKWDQKCGHGRGGFFRDEMRFGGWDKQAPAPEKSAE